ncbi:hypothetical protein [uncultured Mediterranean phage uvMED]|jgi:hypothetical protein|nr:hypothetical protein [uncultured Mediterranean phage uvMED]
MTTKLELIYGKKPKRDEFITKALPIELCDDIEKETEGYDAPFYIKVKALFLHYKQTKNAKY